MHKSYAPCVFSPLPISLFPYFAASQSLSLSKKSMQNTAKTQKAHAAMRIRIYTALALSQGIHAQRKKDMMQDSEKAKRYLLISEIYFFISVPNPLRNSMYASRGRENIAEEQS